MSRHQMMLNEKRDDFTMDDFKACARGASMKRGRAEAIVEEVKEAVGHWPEFADEAGVPGAVCDGIRVTLRLGPFS